MHCFNIKKCLLCKASVVAGKVFIENVFTPLGAGFISVLCPIILVKIDRDRSSCFKQLWSKSNSEPCIHFHVQIKIFSNRKNGPIYHNSNHLKSKLLHKSMQNTFIKLSFKWRMIFLVYYIENYVGINCNLKKIVIM